MNGDKLFNLAGTIVVLATITVLVTNAKGTSTAVGGVTTGFANVLSAAMGRTKVK